MKWHIFSLIEVPLNQTTGVCSGTLYMPISVCWVAVRCRNDPVQSRSNRLNSPSSWPMPKKSHCARFFRPWIFWPSVAKVQPNWNLGDTWPKTNYFYAGGPFCIALAANILFPGTIWLSTNHLEMFRIPCNTLPSSKYSRKPYGQVQNLVSRKFIIVLSKKNLIPYMYIFRFQPYHTHLMESSLCFPTRV